MKHERSIVTRARSKDGNTFIVILRNMKNFQTWYDVEIDKWRNGKVEVIVKDMLDADQAFDFFDRYTLKNNLIIQG